MAGVLIIIGLLQCSDQCFGSRVPICGLICLNDIEAVSSEHRALSGKVGQFRLFLTTLYCLYQYTTINFPYESADLIELTQHWLSGTATIGLASHFYIPNAINSHIPYICKQQ